MIGTFSIVKHLSLAYKYELEQKMIGQSNEDLASAIQYRTRALTSVSATILPFEQHEQPGIHFLAISESLVL